MKKIYLVKMPSEQKNMFSFVKFLMKYKINLYFTWNNEELFEEETLAMIVPLDEQAKEAIEGNENIEIVKTETI